MKTNSLLSILLLSIIYVSCNKNDDSPQLLEIESNQIANLAAIQASDYSTNPPTITGDYIKFNFKTGAATTGIDWDIAFRGTTILVNGGEASASDQPERQGNASVYLTSGTLASVENVDTTLLTQDSTTELAVTTGSDNGWYNYNSTTHEISPIAGKILVVKTHDGKFAKVEILNYYKDMDTSGESQYYTFNYVYQPNEGITTF